MFKLSVRLFLCVFIALFLFPADSFCFPHVALEENFNKNQQNENLRWPWFTDLRNGIRWHYNAMDPHFRAEPEATPFSWGLQDFIFNENVIENDEFDHAMWCANTNRDQVNQPRWPEDDAYMPDQNAWMWWGPVDLSEAIEGNVSFWLYLELAQDAGDALTVVAFTDANLITSQGNEFEENLPVGIAFEVGNEEWQRFEFNLGELILNGDGDNPVSVLGEGEVYLAFVWQTDDSRVEGNRGAFIDDVTFLWDDGLGPQEIGVNRDVIDFGRVDIEEQGEEVLTITNNGDIDLRIENIVTDNEVFTVGFDEPFDIRPDESEDITITFSPPRGQFYEGILSITSDDPENEVLQVSLIGAGGNGALEVVNPVEDVFLDEDPGLVEIAEMFVVFRGDIGGFFFEGNPEELNMELNQGTLSINPDENYNNPEGVEITITARDVFFDTIEDVFTITIAAVNDAPEVVRPIDDIELEEDAGLVFIADLDEVFFDVDGDELAYSFECDVEELNMGIDDDNVLFFEAEDDYNLPDGAEITVTAEDPDGEAAEVVFILIILPWGPWIVVAPIEDVTVDEDPGLVFIADLNDVFFDIDGDEQIYRFFDAPDQLNMAINEDNILLFNPDENFNLPDGVDIIVLAENPDGEVVEDVFNLSINPVNDAPEVVNPIDDIEVVEDEDLFLIADLDDVFFDVDGDELEFSIEGNLEELNMGIDEDNILSFNPDPNFNIPNGVEITIIATDGENQMCEVTFLLVINPVNDLPVWIDAPEEIETDAGDLVEFNLVADDVDLDFEGDELTLRIVNDDGTGELGAEFVDNEDNTGTFSWRTNEADGGVYNLIFVVEDQNGASDDVAVTLTIESVISELNVPLLQGWNLISININPGDEFYSENDDRGPNIIAMMQQLRIDGDNHHVRLMKNEDGLFYSPEFGFGNIQYWNLTEGYLINVDVDVEAVWAGERIRFDADIPIEEGWNFIAYFPTYELDASVPDFYVLSPILDNLELAKDGNGRFMAPEWNFSNMPPWQETQGYQVKVDADVVLNYPAMEEGLAFTPPSPPLETRVGEQGVVPTGQNMSVLVTCLQVGQVSLPASGSQIAAFSPDGLLVGAGSIDSDGMCGIAIWGDDLSTDEVDGLRTGEAFTLKLWNANQDREYGLTPISTLEGKGLIYEPDGLSVLEMAIEAVIPDDFFMSEAYPNPFNSTVRLSYGLPEAANVSICVYDVAGRLVESIINQKQQSGYHTAIWNSTGRDACATASGIYFVRMNAGEFGSVRKVVLVR